MAFGKEVNRGFQDLKAQLKAKEPRNLYIFHGEEVFLLNHYLGQLKKLLIDELTESFNFHRMDQEHFDLQTFADSVENLPMMAERTMVQVDDVDIFKLPELERNKLGEILSDIPPYCCVIFTFETVAWKPDKRLKKLWQAIDENAQIVSFDKQEQRDLIAWITRHFAANKKQITPDLCAYLIEITGGTMTALAGEISKICAYSGADIIKRSDIDAVTEPVLDAVVFQMTELLTRREFAAALQKLQQLLKMQEEPISILGIIGAHYRKLAAARTLLDHGKNAGDLARLYGMQDYAARKMMDAARNVRPEYSRAAAGLILETDRKMKTSFDEPERLLELLVLQLAQEAQA